MSDEDAELVAQGYVSDDRTSMIVLAEKYDPDIPVTENSAYVTKAKEMMAIQEQLLEEGPVGFGKLTQRLKELGDDPDEVVKRFQQEAESSQS